MMDPSGGCSSGADRMRRLAVVVAALAMSSEAVALFSGHEVELRDYGMPSDYFFDLVLIELPGWQRDAWVANEFRPGGAQGYRFSYGSTSMKEAYLDQELRLSYKLDSPWTWEFHHFYEEDPDGRQQHFWTGMRLDLGAGWSTYLFGEPLGPKEFADMGISIGREVLTPDGDSVQRRWELRVIDVDTFYNAKNSINASEEVEPGSLQLSILTRLGSSSWLSFDADRGLPMERVFGEYPGAMDDDQNYRFRYGKHSVEARTGVEPEGSPWKFWARIKGEGNTRSRMHFSPGPSETDWDAEYNLLNIRAELWRKLSPLTEFGFGMQYIEYDEQTLYPNDAGEFDTFDDRRERIAYFLYKDRVHPKLTMTYTLVIDFLVRDHTLADYTIEHDERTLSKLGLALELPTIEGSVRASRFVIGASVFLHEYDFGGAYGQYVASF